MEVRRPDVEYLLLFIIAISVFSKINFIDILRT